MIGWEIEKNEEYNINLKKLSTHEEKFIKKVEEKFREITRNETEYREEYEEDFFVRLLEKVATENAIGLDNYQYKYMSEYAKVSIRGYAFLDYFLKDDEIEEISAVFGKNAWVFIKAKGWKKTNCKFNSKEKMIEVVNKMARKSNKVITLRNPRLDAFLPDGSRLHATFTPICEGEITIRKFGQDPTGPKDLLDYGLCSSRIMAILSMICISDTNVLIAGNTASGKTTTLNSLFTFLPKDERIIIIEDTPEIRIPHEHKINMVANEEIGATMASLIKDTLRMRPDRLIVGEVRSKDEFSCLLETLLAGQARGTYATFHAQNFQEAKGRLEKFGFANEDLESIDVLIIQRRSLKIDWNKNQKNEERKIIDICQFVQGKRIEIVDLKDGKINFESRAIIKAQKTNQMTKEEFEEEITKRERILENAPKGLFEFTEEFQKRLKE
jgi:flagellar protein FlaI